LSSAIGSGISTLAALDAVVIDVIVLGREEMVLSLAILVLLRKLIELGLRDDVRRGGVLSRWLEKMGRFDVAPSDEATRLSPLGGRPKTGVPGADAESLCPGLQVGIMTSLSEAARCAALARTGDEGGE
jgi:hypothetical protein